MGYRSPYTSTLHTKWSCSRNWVATLPTGAAGDGGVRAANTYSTTNICIASEKAWTEALEIPKAANTEPGVGPWSICVHPVFPNPLCLWLVLGVRDDISPAPHPLEIAVVGYVSHVQAVCGQILSMKTGYFFKNIVYR